MTQDDLQAHLRALATIPTSSLGEAMEVYSSGCYADSPSPPTELVLKNHRLVTAWGMEEEQRALRALPGWYARVRTGAFNERVPILAWLVTEGSVIDALGRSPGYGDAFAISLRFRDPGDGGPVCMFFGYFHKRLQPEPRRRLGDRLRAYQGRL